MKNAVDIAIEALTAACAENALVFSNGIARADIDATRKANNAIGAARNLAFAALGLPMHIICNDSLLELLRTRSKQLADAKREQDIAKAKTIWQDLHPCDVRRQVAYVAGQSPDGYSWPTYERFLEITMLSDTPSWKAHYYHCGYVHFMYLGKWAGWWELSWDMFPDDEDLDLYNIKLVVVSLDKTAHTHFPSLLAELNLFKSASEAKKNGWAKPLATGDFLFKKKTYILRIVDNDTVDSTLG